MHPSVEKGLWPFSTGCGGAPDLSALILCVIATLAGARGSALFANKAEPRTLNRITGVVLAALGAAMLIVKFLT